MLVFRSHSLLNWLTTQLVFFSLLLSLDIKINFFIFGAVIAIILLLSTASGIPGGFGIREFSMTYLLLQLDIDFGTAAVYTLLTTSFLILNEVLFFIIGYVMLAYLRIPKDLKDKSIV